MGGAVRRNGGAVQLCAQPNHKVQSYISYFGVLQGLDRSRSNSLFGKVQPRKNEIQVVVQRVNGRKGRD